MRGSWHRPALVDSHRNSVTRDWENLFPAEDGDTYTKHQICTFLSSYSTADINKISIINDSPCTKYYSSTWINQLQHISVKIKTQVSIPHSQRISLTHIAQNNPIEAWIPKISHSIEPPKWSTWQTGCPIRSGYSLPPGLEPPKAWSEQNPPKSTNLKRRKVRKHFADNSTITF